MLSIAEDISDPSSEKAAFVFLGRCVQAWGQIDPTSSVAGHTPQPEMQGTLPGFDQFIYQRLIPTAFRVPSLPAFNIKDGQMVSVRSFFFLNRTIP
jgi:exportin-T